MFVLEQFYSHTRKRRETFCTYISGNITQGLNQFQLIKKIKEKINIMININAAELHEYLENNDSLKFN